MHFSCLLCLYLIPFVCTIVSWDKAPPNQSSHGQRRAHAPSGCPAAGHILITLRAESQLCYPLHSGLVCLEELPMLSANRERRGFQGRVLRSTQRLLQDKEIKWLPLRACSTRSLAENVGPWKYQKEKEGSKGTAPFVKPTSGFIPVVHPLSLTLPTLVL